MNQGKYFLIINPTARSGKAKKEYPKIISLFREQNLSFDFRLTQKPNEAIEIASQATRQKWEAIIAIGGDGTIGEIITGIFKEESVTNKPKLGIIHVGTSPDFNRYHHISFDIQAAFRTIVQGKTKKIDIGKITHLSQSQDKEKTSFFASNVNIGLGPQIASRANSRYRRYLGDFLGTLSSTLVSLVKFHPIRLSIKIDGQVKIFDRLINLTIGKDPYLASGMRVFSDISANDGKLYVLIIKKESWPSMLLALFKLYVGNFLDYKESAITYAKEIEIDYSSQSPEVEYDGDVRGRLPIKIEVIPKALEVIVE